MPTLADVVREHGAAYRARYGDRIPARHLDAMRAVLACKSGALGAHLAACPKCASRHLLPHACRHRACPRCGAADTERFVDRQRELLLPVPYFHLVFTVPAELRRLVREHQRPLLGAICRAAFDALAALCRDPRHLGAQRIGALAVLHTWSRTLIWHPHVHMLVPAVGLADNNTIVRPRRAEFLVPAAALASAYRTRLLAHIRRELPHVRLAPELFSKRWVVYLSATLGGHTDALLAYLGRYVHRTALTDKRILAVEPDAVVLRYRDSATNKRKTIPLHPNEFLRRFLQHVPPKGLHRVRAYGLYHPAARTQLRQLQLALAPSIPPLPSRPATTTTTNKPRLRCPTCHHPELIVICRLSAADLARLNLDTNARAPPSPSTATALLAIGSTSP